MDVEDQRQQNLGPSARKRRFVTVQQITLLWVAVVLLALTLIGGLVTYFTYFNALRDEADRRCEAIWIVTDEVNLRTPVLKGLAEASAGVLERADLSIDAATFAALAKQVTPVPDPDCERP